MRLRRARGHKTGEEPAQIYLREAGRRRTPWGLITFAVLVAIVGGAALYALAVGAI